MGSNYHLDEQYYREQMGLKYPVLKRAADNLCAAIEDCLNGPFLFEDTIRWSDDYISRIVYLKRAIKNYRMLSNDTSL